MGKVRSEIDVDVPISVAYNQWTQFESFPQFMSGVNEVVQQDDLSVRWDVTMAGVKKHFDTKITEQVPDERIAWRSTDGETHAGVVTFHRLSADKTKISVELDWKADGVLEKAGELLQVDDLMVKKDLRDFKRLIESNGFETGAWRGEVHRDSDATGR